MSDAKQTVANQEQQENQVDVQQILEQEKEIEIKVYECKCKDSDRKFNAFKALDKSGKWIDCKFRKEITPPTKDGFMKIKVKYINMAKNTKYPCLWVSGTYDFESKEDRVDNAVNNKDIEQLNDMF